MNTFSLKLACKVLKSKRLTYNFLRIKLVQYRNCTTKLSTEDESEFKKPKREKVIITKKLFTTDPNQPIKILKSRPASEIKKQFNWENKLLYGPVHSSRKASLNEEKIKEATEIIQYETKFPIIEPKSGSQLNDQPNYKHTSSSHVSQEIYLSKILEFPLLNKADVEDNETEIFELNSLRKYLENQCANKLPSVSAILEKTMPKESVQALEHWKEAMIAKLGEEGFQIFKKNLLRRGTSLHENINSFLSATPLNEIVIEKDNLGHWKSLQSVLPMISSVKLLEERVTHPFLCYNGKVDCFAKYKEHLVVIDWKTSKKSKTHISSTFDNPLQIAAYVGALNFDTKFQYLVNKGLIVVAYENGNPAKAHFMDEDKLLHYWKEWLKRIKLFWELQNNNKL